MVGQAEDDARLWRAASCPDPGKIERYNHHRYNESLGDVTPAHAYFGRATHILAERQRINRQAIEHGRLQRRKVTA